ncbi:MAG: ribosomal protein S18-alanine N-acetyltransferase [Chloroflexota bacterium]|nr:ribosomal protein S18-alanine N-acetyltransferase [Chloroflexota bacterium]
MSTEDIPQVVEVERESFPTIWPQTAYRRELQNKLAHYIVITEPSDPGEAAAPASGVWGALRRLVGPPPPAPEHLLGFIGVWMMAGEAHIVTVAVRERYRRMGIGERLLIACIELAMESGQEVVTLEVRKSNDAAQLLYDKYGFERVGLRVRYYTDNNEDAVLMTTPDLASSSYRALFGRLRAEHRARNPDLWQ